MASRQYSACALAQDFTLRARLPTPDPSFLGKSNRVDDYRFSGSAFGENVPVELARPVAVDRVLACDDFYVRRFILSILFKRPFESRRNFAWFGYALRVPANMLNRRRHVDLV